MAEYSKIYKRIWNDPDFRELPDDSKVLYIYLLTSPHSNTIGFYVLPQNYICEDIGWSHQRVTKGLGELFRKGYAKGCPNSRTVMIRSWFKYNKLENPNQLKKAEAELSEIPTNSSLFPDFRDVIKTVPKGFAKGLLEGLPKRYAKPEAEAVTEAEDITTLSSNSEKPSSDQNVKDISRITKEFLNRYTDAFKKKIKSESRLQAIRTKIGARLKTFSEEDIYQTIPAMLKWMEEWPERSKFISPEKHFFRSDEQTEQLLNRLGDWREKNKIRQSSMPDLLPCHGCEHKIIYHPNGESYSPESGECPECQIKLIPISKSDFLRLKEKSSGLPF